MARQTNPPLQDSAVSGSRPGIVWQWKQLIGTELALFRDKPRMLLAAIVIGLIPTLYTIIYLTSIWDPYGQLSKLPAGLVNLDQRTTYRGQSYRLGQDLSDRLLKDRPFAFRTFPDEASARQAIHRGEIYFALIVPPDFSAKAVSGTAQGTVRLVESVGMNFTASVLGQRAAADVAGKLSEEIGKQRWKVILDTTQQAQSAVEKLSAGAQKLERGAGQLSSGLAQAAGGASTLSRYQGQLASGLGRLEGGSQQLGQGIQALGQGTQRLSGGFDQLTTGNGQLAQGAKTLAQASQQLAQGLDQLASGGTELAAKSGELTQGLDKLAQGGQQLAQGSGSLVQGLEQARQGADQLAQGSPALAEGVTALTQGTQKLSQALTQVRSALPAEAELKRLKDGGAELLKGAGSLTGGLAQLSQGSAQLEGGLGELSQGSQKLSAGLGKLQEGLGRLQQNLKTLGGKLPSAEQLQALSGGAKAVTEGASQLGEGGAQLHQGTAKLSRGLQQLGWLGGLLGLPPAGDLERLAAGAEAVQKGLDELSGGTQRLEQGVTALTQGLPALQQGIGQIAAAVPTTVAGDLAQGESRLGQGLQSAQDGAGRLGTGLQSAQQGAGALEGGLQTYTAGASALADGVGQLSGAIAQIQAALPKPEQLTALEQGGTQVSEGNRQLAQGLARLVEGGTRLQTGSDQLAQGLDQAAAGSRALAGGAERLAGGLKGADQGAGQLAAGAQRLAQGFEPLGAGIGQLAQGTQKLSAGAERLGSGATQLSAGLSQARAGASQLAQNGQKLSAGLGQLGRGSQQLQNGTRQLSEGLSRFAQALPKDKVQPQYMAVAVQSQVEKVDRVEKNGQAYAPFFMALSVWIGALMATFLFRVVVLPERLKRMPHWLQVVGKGFVPMLIVLFSVTVLALAVHFGLQAPLGSTFGYYAILVVGGWAFLSLILAIIMLLGDAGKILAVVLLVFQLAAAGGVFPIELSPDFYGAASPWLPLTYLVKGLRATMFGSYDGEWVRYALYLFAYGALGLALGLLSRRRWAYVKEHEYRPALDL